MRKRMNERIFKRKKWKKKHGSWERNRNSVGGKNFKRIELYAFKRHLYIYFVARLTLNPFSRFPPPQLRSFFFFLFLYFPSLWFKEKKSEFIETKRFFFPFIYLFFAYLLSRIRFLFLYICVFCCEDFVSFSCTIFKFYRFSFCNYFKIIFEYLGLSLTFRCKIETEFDCFFFFSPSLRSSGSSLP